MTALSCALCGTESPYVTVALVEWQEPVEDQRWSAVPRCQDRASCRARVERDGGVWEVRETAA